MIAIAVMNMTLGIVVRKTIAMRFMWIPGMRPVKVPDRMPRRNSNIILVFEFYEL